jgi:hypothetical protein
MSHPLDIKLSELSDDQLVDRISMLYERIKFFYGKGNMTVINQLQLMLDEAIIEQTVRNEKQFQTFEQRKKNED